MNLKEQLEEILDFLKKRGITRSEIEDDLNYSENYIDQALSKGGNKRFLKALEKYKSDILQNAIKMGSRGTQLIKEILIEEANKGGTDGKYVALMEERIKELKEDKEWLKRNFEFSLAGLAVGNKSILAHLSTILDKDNEREAAGNKSKEARLKEDSDRRIGEKMKVAAQTGS